jgi:F0F1-type ATP synthase assembly protein I
MRASNGSRPGTPEPPKNTSTVILLLGTIGDTTWRMFVPTLIGIAGGFFLDETLGTSPWFFAAGTITGCVIAGLLIKQQLKNS